MTLSSGQVVVVVVMMVAGLVGAQRQLGSACVDGLRQAGRCTSIRDCKPQLDLLGRVRNNQAGPDGIRILRASICAVRGNNEVLVCCASDTPSSGVVPPTGSGGGSGGTNLLPRRCGVTGLTDRIIDGEDAPLLAWPWMALFRGRVLGQASSWFCGGVLINERYVLTAAHCFKPSINVELEYVRLGEHTLSTPQDCEQGICAPPPQDIPVEQIIRHPEYESPCKECNDIALLRLATPAIIDRLHVVPVCLPVDPVKDMGYPVEEFQGKFAYAAGWGSTSRNPLFARTPDILQQVLLPIRETEFCGRLKVGYPDPKATLCAGGEGKDTCKGDSGGPLVLSNNRETKRFVVGITSLGPRICGKEATQGLYTSVVYYVDWILNTLRP